ncbi:hypothetical protein ACFSAV_04175 [Pasteurella oralis]|uniref:Uncharacterized protein n=1 Tax=Pasteurella oralis TaxID=1071947 RepID=A0ABW4NV69_9PAST
MMTPTQDQLAQEMAALLANLEIVQEYIIEGNLNTASQCYKHSLVQAKRLNYRFNLLNLSTCCTGIPANACDIER